MLSDKRLAELKVAPHLSTMDDALTLISMIEDERLARNIVEGEKRDFIAKAEVMLKESSIEIEKLKLANTIDPFMMELQKKEVERQGAEIEKLKGSSGRALLSIANTLKTMDDRDMYGDAEDEVRENLDAAIAHLKE